MSVSKEALRSNPDREILTEEPDQITIITVKPGFNHLTEEVLHRVEEAGLQTTLWGKTTLTEPEASDLYQRDRERPWHQRVTDYMTSGDITVFVVRGKNALNTLLEVKARIREEHALNRTQNVLHSPNRPDILQENLALFRRLLGPEPSPKNGSVSTERDFYEKSSRRRRF